MCWWFFETKYILKKPNHENKKENTDNNCFKSKWNRCSNLYPNLSYMIWMDTEQLLAEREKLLKKYAVS